MRSLARLLTSAGFIVLLAGAPALAQDISIDYDHNYKFNQMKSYSWGKIQISQPTLEPRVVAAIDRVVQGYGFKESSKVGQTGKPTDMIITVVEARNPDQYASFYHSISDLDWHRGWGSGGFSDSVPSLGRIHGHTLVVDIYSGATHKLVWRGTAAGGISAQEKTSDINSMVNTMFAKFPPASGGRLPPNQLEVPPSPSSTPLTSPN